MLISGGRINFMSLFGGEGFDDFGGGIASIPTFSSSMGGLRRRINIGRKIRFEESETGKKITTKR